MAVDAKVASAADAYRALVLEPGKVVDIHLP
jgi:hypothetical protein